MGFYVDRYVFILKNYQKQCSLDQSIKNCIFVGEILCYKRSADVLHLWNKNVGNSSPTLKKNLFQYMCFICIV